MEWTIVTNKLLLVLLGKVWELLIAPAFYYAALWMCDTWPDLHKHIVCSLFKADMQASKPVLFYTGNKICINTVKKQGMQSASSLYPLAATFEKRLDCYTHSSLEDSSTQSWFVRPVNPTKLHQRWTMFIAAPSFTHADSSAKSCCMKK